MKKSKKKPSVLLRKKHFKQEQKASCVAAAARMLLHYHGITEVSEAELRRILKTRALGTNLFNLLFLRDEKQWSLEVEINVGHLDDLYTSISSSKTPIIVFVNTESLSHWDEATYHVVLVVGYDEETIFINDPFFDKEEIRVPIADFLKAWGKEHN